MGTDRDQRLATDEHELAGESLRRSRQRREADARQRRRQRHRLRGLALAGLLALTGIAIFTQGFGLFAGSSSAPSEAAAVGERTAQPEPAPTRSAIDRAWRYASHREGLVSAAMIDDTGRRFGLRADRLFVSASMVKAVMLAAYLRQVADEGLALDYTSRATLEEMITYSDNDAADTIYYQLGDDPIEQAGRLAGMKTIDVRGYWSETYFSARDCAEFMWRIDRALPPRFRRFAHSLFAGIVAEQRWGIPEAAGDEWAAMFKGGWRQTGRGSLVHQMAQLRRGKRRIALAVLTDGAPSQPYSIETIRGVAERVLQPAASARR
jgi:Beta-lactamase enzyme family